MRNFFLPLSILFSGIIFTKGQVGINTQNPQGIFHIDGAKNNPNSGAPSVLEQNDDIVATSAGKFRCLYYCSYYKSRYTP